MKVKLITPGSKSLNEKSEIVGDDEIGSKKIQTLIDEMYKITGIERSGPSKKPSVVGLAAPQVGVNKRIIILDKGADGIDVTEDLVEVINPEISDRSKQKEEGREGCYSTSRVCGVVNRPISLTLKGKNRKGEDVEYRLSHFPARVAQHETDHLNGVRFPDLISDPKKLHWVPKSEFGNYRKNWKTWTKLCPQEKWLKIKLS